MSTDIKLRPIHYASVSGGKDSLYMLKIIIENPIKYPLDLVVHFELENDWQWSKKVVDKMEEMCNAINIRFIRIKPRKSWEELYLKYGYPSRMARWCNNLYKLDCKKQLNQWIKSQNCRPLAYIGFCADETKRFKYEIGDWKLQDNCYPLAEEGITEKEILEQAKQHELLKQYYKYFERQGCKGCPMARMKEWAYLYLKEPECFEYYIEKMKDTDKWLQETKGKRYTMSNLEINIFEERIKNKWVKKLLMEGYNE